MRYCWLALAIVALLLTGCGRRAPEQSGGPEAQATPEPEMKPAAPELTSADQNKPLTEAEFGKFMATFPEMVNWATERGENLKAAAGASTVPGMSVQGWAMAHIVSAEGQAILKKHGLNAQQFGSIVSRVTMAYAAAQMQEGMSKMEADTAQMQEQLADPDVPEAQKAAIRSSVEAVRKLQQEMQKNLTAPKQNVELVQRHRAELDEMFKSFE